MKKINNNIYMYWFRPAHFKNFGDELGPYIVQKLTGKKIVYVSISGHKRNIFYFILTQFILYLQNKSDWQEIIASLRGLVIKNYLVTIGSIIEFDFSKHAKIWGAGLLNKNGKVNRAKFFAVRGKLTLEKIQKINNNPPEEEIALGDPAILLPKIYRPKLKKKYKIGIIPHIIHYDYVLKNCSNKEINIISLKTDNIEQTVSEICSCQIIITSSLHGLIVPHSYGIPAIRCIFPSNALKGDGTKFKDYFSSVNIETYVPFEFESLNDIEKMYELVEQNMRYALPKNISELQNSLLTRAPFEILPSYKKNDN